ncbi:hypothetical protein [Halomonas daqiaonensis]|uniref:EAL domain-containing protein n=1 Tax=Halomonas daqiaonensis TaxID=650850 RepID=A0A1H7UVU6_9GAMM|nr:hypothetical protein [Halomonas daqiaonensis]SEM01100.1 hypothetical protein SAMN04488129_1223 [Halomonas daqiaonensis]
MVEHKIDTVLPFDQTARLAELRSLDILNTSPEERFDRYTRLVAEIFKVPIAILFYAGAVLRGPSGQPLGTLCIVDTRLRYLTEAQRAMLQELGCNVIQGYLFSRPVTADDALALLKSWARLS